MGITVVNTATTMQLDDFGNVTNVEQQQESGVIDLLAPVPAGDTAAHDDSKLESFTEVGAIVANIATESLLKAPSETVWTADHSVRELRDECSRLGISYQGKKEVLLNNLSEYKGSYPQKLAAARAASAILPTQ